MRTKVEGYSFKSDVSECQIDKNELVNFNIDHQLDGIQNHLGTTYPCMSMSFYIGLTEVGRPTLQLSMALFQGLQGTKLDKNNKLKWIPVPPLSLSCLLTVDAVWQLPHAADILLENTLWTWVK